MHVRTLHVQNQLTETAHAGQCIVLNITGDTEKEQTSRGDWLFVNVPPEPFMRVIVKLQTYTSLAQWQPLYIHHTTSHVTRHVSLLEDNLTELVFDMPLWPADNDHMVLHGISAYNALTEVRVVMLNPSRYGKRKPEYLQWLTSFTRARNDADTLFARLEHGAVDPTNLAWIRRSNGEGVRELLQQPDYIQTGYNLLNVPIAAHWQREILDTLVTCYEQHHDEPGPGCERPRRMALPTESEVLVLLLIRRMCENGSAHSRHGWLHLSDHKADFSAERQVIWQKAEPLFGGEPWWVRGLAEEMGTGEQAMHLMLRQAT